MASGYHTGRCSYGTFPSLQKVLLDSSTVLDEVAGNTRDKETS